MLFVRLILHSKNTEGIILDYEKRGTEYTHDNLTVTQQEILRNGRKKALYYKFFNQEYFDILKLKENFIDKKLKKLLSTEIKLKHYLTNKPYRVFQKFLSSKAREKVYQEYKYKKQLLEEIDKRVKNRGNIGN